MPGAPTNDRLKAGIEKVIRAVFGPRIDYLAPYSAVVKAQAADGSLDLQPDDPRLPGMQGIPIAYGVPGVTAKVASGARVLLMFVGGDPSKPRATLFESASVTQLTLTAQTIVLNNGTQGVARNGDPVKVTIPSGALTLAVSGATATGPSAPLDLVGTITAASGTVNAG